MTGLAWLLVASIPVAWVLCEVLAWIERGGLSLAEWSERAFDDHADDAIAVANVPNFDVIRDRLIAEGDWPALVLDEGTEEVTWS